jgi:hypothetical protein
LRVSGALTVATVVLTLSLSLQEQHLSIANATLISLVLDEKQWKIDFSSSAARCWRLPALARRVF